MAEREQRRVITHDESIDEARASHGTQIRHETEIGQLIFQIKAVAADVKEIKRLTLSEEQLKELSAFLGNRRAFGAATGVLKNVAIWIVAIGAAVVVAKNSFVDAVNAAFGVGK